MATKGLEMFLLQRAKALQHANPALKALVDLQGTYLPTYLPFLQTLSRVQLLQGKQYM